VSVADICGIRQQAWCWGIDRKNPVEKGRTAAQGRLTPSMMVFLVDDEMQFSMHDVTSAGVLHAR
jgi:hypothetical protein